MEPTPVILLFAVTGLLLLGLIVTVGRLAFDERRVAKARTSPFGDYYLTDNAARRAENPSHEDGMRAQVKYTLVLAGILAVFFGGLTALWIGGHTGLYFNIMHSLGEDAYSLPFLDLRGVLAMGECHRLGIDPILPNPCDPLRRILPYGPIVLHEPFATSDAGWLGILQAILFLAAVVMVLRPRTRTELAIMTGASISSGVLYAVERGNFDLVEFLLVAAGVFIATRGFFGRLGSYLLFFAGGTAKFYPFALLITMTRERLAVAVGLGAASFALIAGYLFVSRTILSKLSVAVPFAYNGGIFGATCLPFGLVDWLALPRYAGHLLMAVLVIAFGFIAWRFAQDLRRRIQSTDLENINFQFLVAGATVLAGCFFMGTSISYRTIFLLLLLPGLFDLARTPALRRWAGFAVAAALCCLWSEAIRQWGEVGIDYLLDLAAPDRGEAAWGEAPSILFFVGRELLWWWIVAIMSAIVLLFLSEARAVRNTSRILRIPLPNAN